jgi:glyoxylase-like metal-dependent hydrolase (beta-lactamase superfamily II)
MHLLILGTRGEVDHSASYHSRHSGVLIGSTLLIDLGEREYLEHRPEVVLITHLHPDHAFFVRNKKEKGMSSLAVPVYAPENIGYEEIKILHKTQSIADYTVHPIPTFH